MPRFESIWNQIGLIAKKVTLSIEQIMGILSVRAVSIAETGIGTAKALSSTGIQLLDEVLLNDYKETLSDISKAGAFNHLEDNMHAFAENEQ